MVSDRYTVIKGCPIQRAAFFVVNFDKTPENGDKILAYIPLFRYFSRVILDFRTNFS